VNPTSTILPSSASPVLHFFMFFLFFVFSLRSPSSCLTTPPTRLPALHHATAHPRRLLPPPLTFIDHRRPGTFIAHLAGLFPPCVFPFTVLGTPSFFPSVPGNDSKLPDGNWTGWRMSPLFKSLFTLRRMSHTCFSPQV